MTHNEIGVQEYFKIVDLRDRVANGTATAEERTNYFEQLEAASVHLFHAAAVVGLEYNICVHNEPGMTMVVALENVFAFGAGLPGPLVESMIQKARFDE